MCHGELWTLFVKLSTLQQSSICNNFQRARPAQSALQVCGFGAVAYFLLCRIKKLVTRKVAKMQCGTFLNCLIARLRIDLYGNEMEPLVNGL
jgi:hypothetical protein